MIEGEATNGEDNLAGQYVVDGEDEGAQGGRQRVGIGEEGVEDKVRQDDAFASATNTG